METIIIKTQEEFDALPKRFNEYTVVEIRSDDSFWLIVKKCPELSSVEVWGSSSVEVWGSSSVVARELSRVVARESSSVVARDSSSVVAWDSSSVETLELSSVVAWETSRVVARGSSRVVAWDSSSVVAVESSIVQALESSSVEAWGSSSVVAWGSSSVEAHDFSMITVIGLSVCVKKLLDYSVASLRGVKVSCIDKKDKTAKVVKTPRHMERNFKKSLKKGYIYADGIAKKLISSKKLGKIDVFEIEEFLENKSSYVVKHGNFFSRAETFEKAIEDLQHKMEE